jgi:hypothetical protein
MSDDIRVALLKVFTAMEQEAPPNCEMRVAFRPNYNAQGFDAYEFEWFATSIGGSVFHIGHVVDAAVLHDAVDSSDFLRTRFAYSCHQLKESMR